MTHADLTAQQILDSLPERDRATLQTLAVQRRVSIAALLTEGLLTIARQINEGASAPLRPAPYSNANAA